MQPFTVRSRESGAVEIADADTGAILAFLLPGTRTRVNDIQFGLTSGGMLSVVTHAHPKPSPDRLAALERPALLPSAERHADLAKRLGLPTGYRLLGDLDPAKALACPHPDVRPLAPVFAPDFDRLITQHLVAAEHAKGPRGIDSLESVSYSDMHLGIAQTLDEAAASRALHTASRCTQCGLTYGRPIL